MNAPRTNAAAWGKAGQEAAQSFYNIAETTRKYSPDYGELEKQGIKNRALEKDAAIKAELAVRKSEVKAAGLMEKTNIEVDLFKSKQSAKKTQRKAGMVAAAGGAIAMGLMPDEEQVKPEFDTMRGYLEKSQAKDQTKRDTLANTPILDESTPSEVKPSGGDSAGKVATASAPAGVNKTNSWRALSGAIRFAEGTTGDKGYTTMFGHRQFTDMSRHPNNPMATGWGTQSEAAGAYQFMKPTWDRAAGALGLKDFSRESQEQAGRYLTQQRGVDPDKVITNIDDFRTAMDRLAPEWAGLPYSGVSPGGYGRGSSYYGQGGKDLNTLWSRYQQNLGGGL